MQSFIKHLNKFIEIGRIFEENFDFCQISARWLLQDLGAFIEKVDRLDIPVVK